MSTTVLRTRKFGKVYHVRVDDDGRPLSVAVMNVNGVLRTFWFYWRPINPRTATIVAAAGALTA